MKEYSIDFLMAYPQIQSTGYLLLKTNDPDMIRVFYKFMREYADTMGIKDKEGEDEQI